MLKRFWSKVRKSDGCWEWTGSTDTGGYGLINVAGKQVKAHRFSYELAHGRIDGDLVCHRCDNPPCVNPDHLFAGDAFSNMRDKVAKGRHANIKGDKHPQVKLSEAQARAILGSTERTTDLARLHGVKAVTISAIRARRIWTHL